MIGTLWLQRDGHGQQQYSGGQWLLNDTQLALRGPKCTKKIFITPLSPPVWTTDTRQDGSMLSCYLCQILTVPFVTAEIEARSRQCFSIFYCPVLMSQFSVLSCQEQHLVWFSAAVAHLLQGLMCCALRHGILHTLDVTSGYLSFCCFAIISNQSAQSPLTSMRYYWILSFGILLLDTGYFLFGSFWNSEILRPAD